MKQFTLFLFYMIIFGVISLRKWWPKMVHLPYPTPINHTKKPSQKIPLNLRRNKIFLQYSLFSVIFNKIIFLLTTKVIFGNFISPVPPDNWNFLNKILDKHAIAFIISCDEYIFNHISSCLCVCVRVCVRARVGPCVCVSR